MQGTIAVGYRLFDTVHFGTSLQMTKDRKVNTAINDLSCLQNKCSEFLYTAVDTVDALAMRKFHFNEVMSLPLAKGIRKTIKTNYKYII